MFTPGRNTSYSNNMSRVIAKIADRLGTDAYNLPEHLSKDKWGDIIQRHTLETFSRYFPHQLPYIVDKYTPCKNGWYIIDESRLGGAKILGVRDIDWNSFGNSSIMQQQNNGFGYYDFLTCQYGLMGIGAYQMDMDLMSMYNNGIFIDFQPPNMFKLSSVTGNLGVTLSSFTIYVHVEHSPALTTISATMMELFEDLAEADIAGWLYNHLKLYEGVETVYARVDLKLSELQEKASKRDEIINTIKDSYVSAANKNQPYILAV